MTIPRSLMVIAGEISGDMHAANVIRELHRQDPSLRYFGIGGPRLRAQGVETFYDVREMGVMGIVEVLKRIVFFRRVFREMEALARERRPEAVLLVDYPGFNLRFAAKAHAMGIKVIYYICPQVWAWHRERIPKMAACVDRLMAIFPFEPAVFQGTSLKVDFVGHPLVEVIDAALQEPPATLPWHGSPRIALMPGSRHTEIERLLPPFCAAAALIESRYPEATFLLPAPTEAIAGQVARLLATFPVKPRRLEIVQGDSREVLRQSRAALIKSGTATMEAALIGCPTVIAYKVAPLTYQFARCVVKIPYIGIANIVANRMICPELVQHEATPEKLAAALLPLLEETPARTAMLEGFAEVRRQLGSGGAAARAAAVVREELATQAPAP